MKYIPLGIFAALASAAIMSGVAFADPIKLALTKSAVNIAGYVAKEEGIFEKNGLDIEIVLTASGAEANELLAAGRVDGATLGLGPTAIAWANGFKFWPIAKYGEGADVYAVMARADSGINSLSDLAGKRVAVAKGTDPETAFILGVEAVGQNYADIQKLDAAWSEHASLLTRGDVDAANTNEPFTSIILRDFGDEVKLVTRLGEWYLNGGFVMVSDDIFAKDEAKAIALSYWEAHDLIRDDPEKAADILVKWLDIDPDIAKSSLEHFIANPLFGDRTVSDLHENFRILSEGGRIKSIPDFAATMEQSLNFQKALLDDPANAALVKDVQAQ